MKKMQTTLLYTHRDDEGMISSVTIKHFGDITDAIDELRRAVSEWGKTKEGQKANKETCFDFNWGDLFSQYLDTDKLEIGNETPVKLNRDIIKSISYHDVESFRVEHDERLMEEIEEEAYED